MSDSAQESQKRHFSKIRPHVLVEFYEALLDSLRPPWQMRGRSCRSPGL